MPDANQAIVSARPKIHVAGSAQPRLEQGLSRLEIVETTDGLYRCEAEFINWGEGSGAPAFLYFDRSLLEFGKAFAVKLDTDAIFDGRIMALEGNFPAGAPPTITVLAEDRFQDLRMNRRTRVFDDVSDADVVRRIANDYSLSAQVDASGPTYKVLAQVNQSDLAFMRERSRAIDAELWMEGSTLKMKTREGRRGTALPLNDGAATASRSPPRPISPPSAAT